MFWWQHAAGLVRAGQVQRFGFITTNSLRQTFNRRVVEAALSRAREADHGKTALSPTPLPLAGEGLYLAYAIPDHPWVDSADGAAVRIAMTVGAVRPSPGGGGAAIRTRIAELAEQLDALRKRVLAEHPDLTLTGLYNVLEKGRAGAALTAKEKDIHQRGLVGVLRSLHDEIDAEVLAAYGWSDQPDAETLLTRLVALNTQRSGEETAGKVRWLRPDFQNPADRHSRAGGNPVQQSDLGLSPEVADDLDSRLRGNDSVAKALWPASLPEQVAAVARVLAASPIPLPEAAIAARFTGKGPWKKHLPPLLETLVALGRARVVEGAYVSE